MYAAGLRASNLRTAGLWAVNQHASDLCAAPWSTTTLRLHGRSGSRRSHPRNAASLRTSNLRYAGLWAAADQHSSDLCPTAIWAPNQWDSAQSAATSRATNRRASALPCDSRSDATLRAAYQHAFNMQAITRVPAPAQICPAHRRPVRRHPAPCWPPPVALHVSIAPAPSAPPKSPRWPLRCPDAACAAH